METVQLFERFAVALAIGFLIGVERGWQERDEQLGSRTAGLRTHALLALLGAVAAAVDISRGRGELTVTATTFAVSALAMTMFRYRETQRDGTFGATTLVGAILTVLLGAYAVLGDMQVAAAAGVAVAGLLALKGFLHGVLRRVSWAELRSALLLLAMTVILLPVLPNRPIDPWQAINPYELWLMTVLLAALSFAGYVAMKLGGDRLGVAASGVAGGLVSSTAATVTLARLAATQPGQASSVMAGILFAGTTMIVRTLVIVGIVNPEMSSRLLLPASAAAVVLAGAGALWFKSGWEGDRQERQIDVGNPFEPLAVISFGLLLTAITFIAKIASVWAGTFGVYGLAAVSGVADVDAITLSMARIGGGVLSSSDAATAVLIAIAVNSVAKAALAGSVGGEKIGRPVAWTTALAIGAGAAAFGISKVI